MKDFKEEMRTNFIPRVECMIEKEEAHLKAIESYKGSVANSFYEECKKTSINSLNHLKIRLLEYKEYVKKDI